MAFYKLFYLLHRRTDWPDLLDLEKQFMMPEQYIAAKRQAEMALVKLMIPFTVLNSYGINPYR